MTATGFQIGEYQIETRRDASGLLVGSVTNKRYPIRLHADTRMALEAKFERVLTRYLGATRKPGIPRPHGPEADSNVIRA